MPANTLLPLSNWLISFRQVKSFTLTRSHSFFISTYSFMSLDTFCVCLLNRCEVICVSPMCVYERLCYTQATRRCRLVFSNCSKTRPLYRSLFTSGCSLIASCIVQHSFYAHMSHLCTVYGFHASYRI